MALDRRWNVRDRYGNEIYITSGRWEHVLDGHPEMAGSENELRETLRSGNRSQDSLNPQKFRYRRAFATLAEENTHIEAIVLFRFEEGEDGRPHANNYVVTAYQKQIG